MVGSKVIAFFTRYSSLAGQTSSSRSFHSIATPRKTTSRNSWNNLSAIQLSDRKLWLFGPVTQVWPTRVPRHRVGIPYQPKRKQLEETRPKIMRDPIVGLKVMAILTCYSSLADQTSSSSSFHSIATPRKTTSRNSCNNLSAIQLSNRKLWPLGPVTQVWLTRPPRRRVAIP